MNWYVLAKKIAAIPENFDVVEKSEDHTKFSKWKLFAGANDWESGVTLMSVLFDGIISGNWKSTKI